MLLVSAVSIVRRLTRPYRLTLSENFYIFRNKSRHVSLCRHDARARSATADHLEKKGECREGR
jgi:hypothetical protein